MSTPIATGERFSQTGEEGQQQLLRQALLEHVPLVRQLQAAIEDSPRSEVEEETVLELLDDAFTGPEAAAILATLVDWTRSCGLLRYSRERKRFQLAGGDEDGG